jgi:hypothetical protein
MHSYLPGRYITGTMGKQLQLIATFWMTWLATCFIFTSKANNRRLNSRAFFWSILWFQKFNSFHISSIFWKFKVKKEYFKNILIVFVSSIRKFGSIKNADCAVLCVDSILAMSKVKYGERTRSSSFIPHATLLVQLIFWSVLRHNFSPQKKIPNHKAINCNHVWNRGNLVSSIIIEQMNTSN